MMYNFKCEYCGGLVAERRLKREAFKHKDGFVIIENVPVGVCDKCGYRYYHASVLHQVQEIADNKKLGTRFAKVPVVHLSRSGT